MIRSGHLDGHHRGDDRVAGENVVDGDHRRKPGVGGVGGRETRSGLFDGVVVAVGQQVVGTGACPGCCSLECKRGLRFPT
jgi:hypothetical protein